MPTISRVRTSFSGFPGGPGVATMYTEDPTLFTPALQAFWARVVPFMPISVTAKIEDAGDSIEELTGALVSDWTGPATGQVIGGQNNAYAAPAGVAFNWRTVAVLDGNRLMGRTFLVPLAGNAYEPNGSIIQTALDEFRDAASDFVLATTGNFVVWHRPVVARAATPTSPARAARAGGSGLVTAAQVPDKVAILRSRRD